MSRLVRDMLIGAVLMAVIVLVWGLATRVSEWFKGTIEQVVEKAVQNALPARDPEVEDQVAQEEALLEVVIEAVEETEQFYSEIYRQRARMIRGDPMSTEMANRIIRYNVAVMTRRYRMDMINNEHQLQQVDIATNLRLERFKTRLGSSVRATLGGTLNEQAFQSALGFTPRTTVGAAADTLKQAFDGAWSPRG